MADNTDPIAGLSGSDRDAALLLTNLFNSYGLGTLAPVIVDYIKQGYSSDTITVLLQQTKEYQDRFSANKVRIQKGLPALSPAEYLATEDAYRQTLRKWGLPSGFYDSTDDFKGFLESDISPVELDQRAQQASDFMNSADDNQMSYYKQFYTNGDLVAFALDPNRAAPLVGKAFKASQIGGAAMDQGLGTIDQAEAEKLANLGVTADQASSGFGQIAQARQDVNTLGGIYGGGLSTQELIDATFANDADSTKKLKTLASKERAQFGGSAGLGATSLVGNGSND